MITYLTGLSVDSKAIQALGRWRGESPGRWSPPDQASLPGVGEVGAEKGAGGGGCCGWADAPRESQTPDPTLHFVAFLWPLEVHVGQWRCGKGKSEKHQGHQRKNELMPLLWLVCKQSCAGSGERWQPGPWWGTSGRPSPRSPRRGAWAAGWVGERPVGRRG